MLSTHLHITLYVLPQFLAVLLDVGIHVKHFDPYKPSGAAYIVEGTIIDDKDKIAHLHVVPLYAFGTVMAILSTFSGLGIYSKFRRK